MCSWAINTKVQSWSCPMFSNPNKPCVAGATLGLRLGSAGSAFNIKNSVNTLTQLITHCSIHPLLSCT